MANFNFNEVILAGRLTADPELKQTPGGIAVTSFSIAVNRIYKPKDGEREADFIGCAAWRQTAEFVSKYFRKGSSICVVGRLQTRSWTDQDGKKRYATEVIADEVHFVDSRSENQQSVGAMPAVPPASQYVPEQYQVTPNMQEIGNDEDFPF